ncbi:hypothetical protein [Thermoleophilum album]|uniref:Uncharacterized protein n=1 Tax=Thermoleophilum album TaxID=29539 RepID=A0A1H6FS28_THEAL|nr:hypothetical protein [Thermoleophilum album]SEH13699.1 hypothetical protein SAMN02745716_1269 [Thermoleophilum album]
MPWTESQSASFGARHERSDTDDAQNLLLDLEEFRAQLSQLFPRTPGEVHVVLHPSDASLVAAQPALVAWRATQTATARRYLAGWPSGRELHVLAPRALRQRAAPRAASLRALALTARRLYVQVVAAHNGVPLPPPLTPARSWRLWRLGWLWEGPAAVLAGQGQALLPALATRLREGPLGGPPPGPRDALLGGLAVAAALADRDGEAALARLYALAAEQPPRDRGERLLERAFRAPLGEVGEALARFQAEVPRRLARHAESP